MSSIVAESPLRTKLKERRRIADVVGDLLASSQQVQTPVGLVTLVDLKFLRELTDVQVATGEQLFAVVDAEHLERCGFITGIEEPTPLAKSPVKAKPSVTQMKELKHHYGWTTREMAMAFECSEASVGFWTTGRVFPSGRNLERAWELIHAMEADKAREAGASS